jgi:Prealbumin-like fold domain
VRLLRAQENPPNGPVFSTGNRELSLQATALAPVPSPFTTQVDRSSVEVGSAVVDTATLGGRPGKPVSGEVNFFVCFSPTVRPDCTFNGVQVGPGQVVVAPSPTSPDGVASVQFVPDAPGFYCFRAEYVPSATAVNSPAAHTNTTTECFEAVVTPPRLTLTKICIPSTDGGASTSCSTPPRCSPTRPCGDSIGPFDTTAGTHTVSETAGTDTDLADYTSTVGGNCTPITPTSGSITLANGDSATCTITNQRNGTGIVTGTLTVNKVCVPPNDGGLFELNIDSLQFPDVPCGGSTGPVVREAGAHTVGEPAGGTDTSLSDYTTVIGGDCAADGTVTVAAGGAATCTITNTRIPVPPATLTVTKLCVPGGGARFTITIDGRAVGTVGCGGSTGAVEVTPGQRTVGETGAGGTDLSDYTVVQGGDCQADGTVFVGAGQHATCTITNIRKTKPPVLPPMLTVVKVCVPSDDGGLFTLTIDGHASANQPCGGRLGPLVVSPGVHHVGEAAGTRTSLSNYTTIVSGDCAADGSVTVAAGQSATCTITNVRKGESTAQITIVKQCRPRGVAAHFQLNLDEHVFQRMRCGDSTGPVVTGTGVHSIGEVAANAKPGLFKTIISGDCSPNGAITLAPGQHATCVVTNVRRPLRPGRPPALACYRLTVARRMVTVGRVLVRARVLLHRRPIRGVRVFAVAPGVFEVRTTDARGKAIFLLRLRRAGILRMTIRRPYACPKPPPKKIGVLGLSQPFLTG